MSYPQYGGRILKGYAKSSPPVSSGSLRRERLLRRLDDARQGSVVWLAGPPGAGKTTLLSSWVGTRRVPCLWLRLDAADADPANFLEALHRAARTLAKPVKLPRFGPAYALGLDAFFHTTFRRLFEAMPEGGALVLDDCQAVPSGAPLFSFLRQGLAELPPAAVVVLASREPPPPPFQALVAGGRLEVLGGADLLLTSEEARSIARARGVEDAGELRSLVERAAGWAAGLILLLRARRSGASRPGPADEATFDYLATEVLDRADDTTRRVLLETAMLPWIDAEVAEARLGIAGAREVLARMARDGYFTVRLGGPGLRYRLHPLLHDLLRRRAADGIPASRLASLRRTAATALAEAGDETGAVALLRDAGAWPELAALLRRCAPGLLDAGRAASLAEWLTLLPPDLLAGSPWMRYFLGLARFGSDPLSSQAELQAALDAFEAAGEATGAYLAWAALAESFIYASMLGPLDACLERLDRLRASHPVPSSPNVAARVSGSALLAATWRRLRSPTLLEWLDQHEPLAASEPRARLMAGISLSVYEVGAGGHLAKALAVLDAVSPRNPDADPAAAVIWRSADANLKYATGDAEGSIESAETALALSASSGVRLWDFMLTAQVTWAAAMAGRLETADRAVARLGALYDPSLSIQGVWLHQARCLVAIARHDPGLAYEEIRAARASAERAGSDVSVATDLPGEAWTAEQGGAPPGQGPSLEAALEFARRCGSRWGEHMALMGLAARERLRGGPNLEARLREAFGQARETGYRNPVYLRRDELAELCAAALERGVEPDSVRSWVSAHRLAPPDWARDLQEWPWALSVRVLGRFEVDLHGLPPDASVRGSRALDLLAVLVALGGSDVPGEWLAAELWPDSEGDSALHAMETALYRLRKVLGDPDLVVQVRGLVGLAGGRCRSDLQDLERRLEGVERASLAPSSAVGEDLPGLAAAVLRAYAGPLLPAIELPAVRERRAHLDSRVRRAIGAAAAALERASRGEDAAALRDGLAAREGRAF